MAPYQKVTVTCLNCGKVFKKSPSAVRERNYCCKECHAAHWGKQICNYSPMHDPTRRVPCTCQICGKEFTIIRSWLKNGGGKYCSRACAHEAKRRVTGENHPLYTKITCTCLHCGKEYTTKKVYEGRTKFCSRQCHGAYTAHHKVHKNTGIEIAVENMLKDIGIEYEAQKPMGSFLCDFYVRPAKLVIECDGVYWHSIPEVKKRDKRKDKWLIAHKQRILRLKERDIERNPDWCKLQILIAIAG